MLKQGRMRWSAIAWGVILASGLTGCVERRYTIRTDPPGALVVVNNEEIGRTPVSRSFIYYGDRDVTLMMDGFRTQHLVQPIKPPWYDNMLTEFVTENVLPWTIRDERDYTYQLAPATVPATNDLLARGENLKIQAQSPPPPRRGGILGFFGF